MRPARYSWEEWKSITGQWLDKHAMFVTKTQKEREMFIRSQGMLRCREHGENFNLVSMTRNKVIFSRSDFVLKNSKSGLGNNFFVFST